MQKNSRKITTVLFDLDGTLIDTAPDLCHCLNELLIIHEKPPIPFATARPYAALGATGLIKLGFGYDVTHPDFQQLRTQYLNVYQLHLTDRSQPFPKIHALLDYLEQESFTWGIVTNKFAQFTIPLLKHLNLFDRAAIIVSGDSTQKNKPAPDPILFACQSLNISPHEALYVGDTKNDAVAAQQAGMPVIIVKYGYMTSEDHPESWQPNALVNSPQEIAAWLLKNNSK